MKIAIQLGYSPLQPGIWDSESLQSNRRGNVFLQSFQAIFYSLRRWVFRLSLYKNVFVSEASSLVPRIRYRVSKNLDCGGVDFGPAYQAGLHGHLQQNTQTQSRIDSTQRMLSNRAWATMVEVEVFLAGWNEGVKWTQVGSSGNACNGQSERESL